MARRGWKPDPRFRKRIKETLERMPKAAADEITEAQRRNGEEAKAIIRADAPRDQGDVEKSVNWVYGDPPPGVLGKARGQGRIPWRLRISIFAGGTKAPHAHLAHNGTKARVRKNGRATGIMPPQPFFWPNIRALRRRMRGRISRRARRGLKRAIK